MSFIRTLDAYFKTIDVGVVPLFYILFVAIMNDVEKRKDMNYSFQILFKLLQMNFTSPFWLLIIIDLAWLRNHSTMLISNPFYTYHPTYNLTLYVFSMHVNINLVSELQISKIKILYYTKLLKIIYLRIIRSIEIKEEYNKYLCS